ncbi:1529_t:CDS:1 [Gigaspora margarita]|uniref:1529_t:CDS:1 n=1 Tax=Gigaspora margarita TaxID=4874 RepID=A0ABM8VXI8_GIGMA|nr:1529_t:CDS:1 [Gigaspora margarita]
MSAEGLQTIFDDFDISAEDLFDDERKTKLNGRIVDKFHNNSFRDEKKKKAKDLTEILKRFKKRELHTLQSLKDINNLYKELISGCQGVRKGLKDRMKILNIEISFDVMIGAVLKVARLEEKDPNFNTYADIKFSLSYLNKTSPEDIMKKINEKRGQNHNSGINETSPLMQSNIVYKNSPRRSISLNSTFIPGANNLEFATHVFPQGHVSRHF